ncbi:MAG: glycosyltransferase [Candidatus Brocadia sp.]
MPTPLAQRYFKEAQTFEESGLLEKAIASYKKAIEINPYFISAYYILALLYYQTQQFDNAVIHFKKVIELDPNDASAFNNLGVIFSVNNRLHEAKIYFEKALSLDANYKEAQDNLKKIQEKLQKAAPYSSSLQSIKYHCRKIGFVTLWYERGQAYVTRAIRDALANDHTTFIFARNGGTLDKPMLQTTGEWDIPNLVTHPTYQIPHDELKNWIVNNNLDIVFFNEEYDLGLVEAAKECKVKTVGYYVWELFDPQFTAACKRLYDKIICPTMACYKKFKDVGMDNVEYIQWGVDLNLFKSIERPVNKRTRFFHPAGWGGLHARRGTQFVIDAFQKLNDPNAELLIHTQNGLGIQENNNIKIISGTVPREEIIKMYQNADVAVLPSKWEGLGLTFLEAIGCGLPIITVDAPPMTEFVENNKTGFLCRVAERRSYPGIFVEGVHVDIDDMANKMRMMLNADLRSTLHENVKAFASKFSIMKFKENMLGFIHDITKRIDDIRLNLGCGTDIRQGYVNIDQRRIKGVNQIADVSNLPYKSESVVEVLANDVIEHFPREQTEAVLNEWIRVLRPGGILKIQCPDVRTLANGLISNVIPVNEFSRRIYGGQNYGGNFHYAGFDIPEMKRMLRRLGMRPQQVSAYNGNFSITACRKFQTEARKLRVILIGARLSNYPWGTENFIHKALSEFGHDVIDIDLRRDCNRIGEIHKIPADLVIVYKGSGLNPRLLEMLSCQAILWYPDDVLTVQHAQEDLQKNGYAYDRVYYFDRAGLEKLRQMGITHSTFLPLATAPAIYKYLPGTEKKHDVVFVGNIYPNRRALLDQLKRKFNVFETMAFMEDMVRIFNEAKIVLNLGIGKTGYQLRVFEALGCRSFLLTNEINMNDRLFKDKEHLVYFNEQNIEDLISYYLNHEDEREAIAENGYREVCAKHTFKHRMHQILIDSGFTPFAYNER